MQARLDKKKDTAERLLDAEAGYHGAQKALYIGVHQVLLYYWRNVACLDDDPKQKREKWKMENGANEKW